jgi:hypothetical protein
MSGTAVPRQVVGLMPKVKGLKGLRPKIHNIYPINSSGTTSFNPTSGNNQIVFSIPAFKNAWLNVQRSLLRFKFQTNSGSFPVHGVHPFNRLQIRCGNQVVEDIQGYSTICRVLSNMDSVCKKMGNAHASGDFRSSTTPPTTAHLKSIYENGTIVEHNFASGILGRDYQEHYLALGAFNASGGSAMEITLWLEDPSLVCVRDSAGTPDFTLSEVEMQLEIVEMPQNVNEKLDKELFNGGKISIPFKTFRLHNNHISQDAQNAELSINESAQNLSAVFTTIRPQSLPAVVDYDATTKPVDNLMFLGAHGDHTTADNDASYVQTAKVKSFQYSYDTLLMPQKRLEMSSRDSKNALLYAVSGLDLWDTDSFIGSYNKDGVATWERSGVFFIGQNMKSSRDDYLNGINTQATGAPLLLSLSLAKPAQVPLKLETFCQSEYTLNITKMGQASVLNGSAQETPV